MIIKELFQSEQLNSPLCNTILTLIAPSLQTLKCESNLNKEWKRSNCRSYLLIMQFYDGNFITNLLIKRISVNNTFQKL